MITKADTPRKSVIGLTAIKRWKLCHKALYSNTIHTSETDLELGSACNQTISRQPPHRRAQLTTRTGEFPVKFMLKTEKLNLYTDYSNLNCILDAHTYMATRGQRRQSHSFLEQ